MTTPDVFANGEDSANSFLNAPSGQGDGPRLVIRTATVPDSSSVGTLIGLVPFQKGARVQYGSVVATAQLDTDTLISIDIGFVYDDNDTSANINDVDAFVDGSTTARAGGVMEFTNQVGTTFEATAQGWITATILGGPVTLADDLTFNGTISYQG